MQNADFIIGSSSIEMLLPFFSLPTLPFKNEEATCSKGNRAEGQIYTKHGVDNDGPKQPEGNLELALLIDAHPVERQAHIAAVTVDAQASGCLLATARRFALGDRDTQQAIGELASEALFRHPSLSNRQLASHQATLGLTS